MTLRYESGVLVVMEMWKIDAELFRANKKTSPSV